MQPTPTVTSLSSPQLNSTKSPQTGRPQHIMHLALQGCLRGGGIDYGLTADTGGHIRYLLDVVEAIDRHGIRQTVVTRGFEDGGLGLRYARPEERLMPRVPLRRIFGDSCVYLPKEKLHQDMAGLTRNLLAYLSELDVLPDVIHAHYADAGTLAANIKDRLGIPFLFTAHSLGAVKAKATDDASGELERRIAIEQAVIEAADGIVVSSNDETHNQYGLYHGVHTAKIYLNPPGCDLAAFQQRASYEQLARVRSEQERFLADSGKPALLALARPVHKKNLLGLIDAYGRNPELQSLANLVIYAGKRESLSDQEPECAEVLRLVLQRMDHYDLYGRLAIPKCHDVVDVPAIYQHTAGAGGLFVNVALNEPFGLTFLEAAAAGLPVVATNRGGPVDIVGHCKHGLLVDPTDCTAIANTAITLLTDAHAWQTCRLRGQERVAHFNWDRHVRQYLTDCANVLRTDRSVLPPSTRCRRASGVRPQSLLVTDVDDTLLGDSRALPSLSERLHNIPGLVYAVATGRRAAECLALLKAERAPIPEYIIGAVGSEIFNVVDGRLASENVEWEQAVRARWDRHACKMALADVPGLTLQEATEQTPGKLSYLTGGPEVVETVRERFTRLDLDVLVVFSHDQYLDVMPRGGSKGGAAHYLARALGVPASRILAAGDSGNDLDLLGQAGRGVIVGNAEPSLMVLRDRDHLYLAERSYTAGLLEGLSYWRAWLEAGNTAEMRSEVRPGRTHRGISNWAQASLLCRRGVGASP